MDGNSVTVWTKGSCTHTKTEDKAWWRVDLGKVERVTEVYIVNRDSVGVRLSKFEIRVGRLPLFCYITCYINIHDVHVHKGQIVGLGVENVITK